MLKHIKRVENTCFIPNLVQTFSWEEDGGLNLVLRVSKPLTCMTDAYNSSILAMMCERKQTDIEG